VTIPISASDACSGVQRIHYAINGAPADVFGPTASIDLAADGLYDIEYYAVDAAGNSEAPHTLQLRVDRTPPAVACRAMPALLWPANHRLVDVTTAVTVDDAGSGADGFVLTSATSSEPDAGLGDGDTANDVQGFAVGTASIAGQLRAERSGTGSGRAYTLRYVGRDAAGNEAACAAIVTVPHNR
jgi:hypothetical protein